MIAFNIIGRSSFSRDFDFLELLIILSIFLFIICILLWYRKKISTGEKSVLTDFSKRPLYKSRDVLMQEKHIDDSIDYLPLKATTSIYTKLIIVGLILILFLIPFERLLSVVNAYKIYY
ncbi:MAG: hypothetical protein JXQ93_11395 [Flavobacteriaceae bacterium]